MGGKTSGSFKGNLVTLTNPHTGITATFNTGEAAAKFFKISRHTVYQRVHALGWSIWNAYNTPIDEKCQSRFPGDQDGKKLPTPLPPTSAKSGWGY